MEKDLGYGILKDIYGDFLSQKQREIVEYYYDYDMSLSEIAQNIGITRQGVRDYLVKAEKTLSTLENKLSLKEIVQKLENCLKLIDGQNQQAQQILQDIIDKIKD